MAPLPRGALISYRPATLPESGLSASLLGSLGSAMKAHKSPQRQRIRRHARGGCQIAAPSETGFAPRDFEARGLLGLPRHREVRAAVLLPALLGRLGADRDFLAVGDGLEPLGRHSQRDDVVVGGTRAPLAEREVVLDRSALVAVALDPDDQEVEFLERRGVLLQRGAVGVADVRLVEFEVHLSQEPGLLDLLGAHRLETRVLVDLRRRL